MSDAAKKLTEDVEKALSEASFASAAAISMGAAMGVLAQAEMIVRLLAAVDPMVLVDADYEESVCGMCDAPRVGPTAAPAATHDDDCPWWAARRWVEARDSEARARALEALMGLHALETF